MDRALLILQAAVFPVTDVVRGAARLNDVTGARSRQRIERNARLDHGRVGIDQTQRQQSESLRGPQIALLLILLECGLSLAICTFVNLLPLDKEMKEASRGVGGNLDQVHVLELCGQISLFDEFIDLVQRVDFSLIAR